MAVSKAPLGMNARNFLYLRTLNKPSIKLIADDKIATKKALLARKISTAKLVATFTSRNEVRHFAWGTLPESFVVKPARGYGGEGILVMKEWNGTSGKTVSGVPYTTQDLETHLFDVLEGSYSLQFLPDAAFIEERLVPQRFFKKVLPVGMPDIRVIVCNGIPIMAMMRVPTGESDGKANIHQGALAVGIDIATGVTTRAILHNKPIIFFPNTKIKPHGLKIPHWEDILLLAIHTQQAVPLGYIGVDIVIDVNHGPVVLEVNARPGLAIQIANNASLRTRLERVGGMERPNPERALGIAQSLFAESFSEKVSTGDPIVLGVIESVVVIPSEGGERSLYAKVDTGAFRTSIDSRLARKLKLQKSDEVVNVQSASGVHDRETVHVTFKLGGKNITTIASVVNREHMRYPMIIGRRDMTGFLVDPMVNKKRQDTETPKKKSAA